MEKLTSNSKLNYASVGIYALCAINLVRGFHVFYGGFTKPTPVSDSVLFQIFLILIGLIFLAFSYWIYKTPKRLLSFQLKAWKHAMFIAIWMIFDPYATLISIFVIYCLMDKNIRLLFKKRDHLTLREVNQ